MGLRIQALLKDPIWRSDVVVAMTPTRGTRIATTAGASKGSGVHFPTCVWIFPRFIACYVVGGKKAMQAARKNLLTTINVVCFNV